VVGCRTTDLKIFSNGIFNDHFIANFQEIVKVIKFRNRPLFDEVMPRLYLSGHGVYTLMNTLKHKFKRLYMYISFPVCLLRTK